MKNVRGKRRDRAFEEPKEADRLRRLSEASLEAIVFIEDGIIVDANDALNRLFGCASRDHFCSISPADASPQQQPDGADSLVLSKKRIAEAMRNGSHRFEWMHKRLNTGETFAAEVLLTAMVLDGKPVLQAVVRDITERKEAEETLRRERDFNRSMIESSPAFLVAMDRDGRVLLMNDSMLRALGYTLEEVIGKDYLETFAAAQDRALVKEVFSRLVNEARPTVNENRVVTKDGKELVVEWHGRALRKPDGRLDYFFGVGIDISERKHMEEELQQHEDHLEALVLQRTLELEQKTGDLNNANAGLRALLKVKEEDVRELEAKVLSNVRELIIPSLERLKRAVGKEHSEAIRTLEANLNSITSPFIKSIAVLGLTPAEGRIATLIRDGKTIKEIAELLHISPRSVERHRYNMRRKLQMNKKKTNLQSFLRSIS